MIQSTMTRMTTRPPSTTGPRPLPSTLMDSTTPPTSTSRSGSINATKRKSIDRHETSHPYTSDSRPSNFRQRPRPRPHADDDAEEPLFLPSSSRSSTQTHDSSRDPKFPRRQPHAPHVEDIDSRSSERDQARGRGHVTFGLVRYFSPLPRPPSSATNGNPPPRVRGETTGSSESVYNDEEEGEGKDSGDDYDGADADDSRGDGHGVRGGGGGKVGRNAAEDGGGDEDSSEGEEGEGNHRARSMEKILAIHAPYVGQLAAALYDPSEKKVSVLEDTKDNGRWDFGALLLEQCDPDRIVYSTKTQDAMADIIEAYCNDRNNVECQPQTQKSFTVSSAITQMTSFDLLHTLSTSANGISHGPSRPASFTGSGIEDEPEEGDPGLEGTGYMAHDEYSGMGKVRMTLVKLGCMVNVDAPLAMSAIGGLLSFLRANHAEMSTGIPVVIEKLESMALEQYMLLNQDALESLAIFDMSGSDKEPGLGSKERKINLYNEIRQHCSTPTGKSLLRLWLLRPLLDIERISERHDAVDVFIKHGSGTSDKRDRDTSLVSAVRQQMKKIKDIKAVLVKVRLGTAGWTGWRVLTESVMAMTTVKELLEMIPGTSDLPVVQKLHESLDSEFQAVVNRCARTIDWDTSREVDRVCVRPGVDQELDDLKQAERGIESILSELSVTLAEHTDVHFYETLKCMFWNQYGFLVEVVIRDGGAMPRDWDPIVEYSGYHYFKTPETAQLDGHYGDISGNIKAKEAEIVHVLADTVIEYEDLADNLVQIISELDCLLAFAKIAYNESYVRPRVVQDPVLLIKQGRHILQQKCVEEGRHGKGRYIPNDTYIEGGQDGQDYHSMMIVTGANASGKSAYGKQIALLALMAQIGCFVPAEKATIGVVDKIFTRIQTKESVSKPASAFMIDLEQVSHALRGATERSLIILDEFGKGTNAHDGAGLLAGVIEYLLSGGCPRTVVLTHFHELFTQKFIAEDLPIQFCYMRTEFFGQSDDLGHLYKLTPGRCHSSHAAECALANGLPKHIVERAKQVTEMMVTHQMDKLWDNEVTEAESKHLEKCELLAKRFLSWEIDPDTTDIMETLRHIYETAMGMGADEEPEDTKVGDSKSNGDSSDGGQAQDFDARPEGVSRSNTRDGSGTAHKVEGERIPASNGSYVVDGSESKWTVTMVT